MSARLTRYCTCGTTLVLNSAVDVDLNNITPIVEAFLDLHRGRPGHGETTQDRAQFARDVAEAKRGSGRVTSR